METMSREERHPENSRPNWLSFVVIVIIIGILSLFQLSDSGELGLHAQNYLTNAPVQFASASFEAPRSIDTGTHISVRYSVLPVDENKAPLVQNRRLNFTVGEKHYLPALDDLVRGMAVGQTKIAQVSGTEIFGPRHEGLMVRLSKDVLPKSVQIKEGEKVWFATPGDNAEPHPIIKVDERSVVIDMNHPYAGEPVTVRFQVTKVLS